jgi:hypothetical protein
MSAEDDKNMPVSVPSNGEQSPVLKPIVLDYKKWGKKGKTKVKDRKPKFSKGLKDIQLLEGDSVHIAQTAAQALSKSINTYDQERQQSAKKKRDGAIEDFIHNSAKASSTYLKESSDMPVDLADALSRLSFRKNLRKNLRRASKRILIWPI